MLYCCTVPPFFLWSTYTVQQAGFDSGDGPFSSPSSLLEDPPLGDGWDENGNDLSKAANDVSNGWGAMKGRFVRYPVPGTTRVFYGDCGEHLREERAVYRYLGIYVERILWGGFYGKIEVVGVLLRGDWWGVFSGRLCIVGCI